MPLSPYLGLIARLLAGLFSLSTSCLGVFTASYCGWSPRCLLAAAPIFALPCYVFGLFLPSWGKALVWLLVAIGVLPHASWFVDLLLVGNAVALHLHDSMGVTGEPRTGKPGW
jgi:hypothetical protein